MTEPAPKARGRLAGLASAARRVAGSARAAAASAGAYAASDTVRVAVTGLSGAGKTVFITALAQNLLRTKDRKEALPFFGPAAQGRIEDVTLEIPSDKGFPIGDHLTALRASDRRWPRSTTATSHLRIVINYRPAGAVTRTIANAARLTLEITDYPGEWLLDLSLIGRSFRDWSIEQIAAAARPPRNALAQRWMQAAAATDPAGNADPTALDRIGETYARYLAECRKPQVSLSLLQPGRYLCPGDASKGEIPWFFPMVAPTGLRCGAHSALAELERRYGAYRKTLVEPFYRDHFRRFDRQIVLVDVLGALNAGPDAVFDMQEALRETMRNFRYARDRWLQRLIGTRIGTVVFAATKADHVTANQYHNLRTLLSHMVEGHADVVERKGATVHYVALASIKSTTNAERELDGQRMSVLRGVIKGERERRDVFPGEIPDDIPDRAYWTPDHFRFYDFMPPKPEDGPDGWFRHIHLDQVLRDLLEERLR